MRRQAHGWDMGGEGGGTGTSLIRRRYWGKGRKGRMVVLKGMTVEQFTDTEGIKFPTRVLISFLRHIARLAMQVTK